MLFDSAGKIDFKANAKILADGFGKPEFWQTTIMDFEDKHRSCFELISKEMYAAMQNEQQVDLMDL